MQEILDTVFLGNPTSVWATFAAVLACSLIAIMVIKRVVIIRLKQWSLRTKTSLDDFLITITETSVVPLLYLAAFYFSLKLLNFSKQIDRVLYVAFLLVFTFYVLQIVTAAVKHFVFSFIEKKDDGDTKEKQAKGLLIIINVVIWIAGFVFLIDNLGYNVTTLITGLGIGGIAIALAAQTILGDLFSYFIIFFDRPFEIGDFIVVDDKSGTVEYIGIKTTRLRTLSGEQLICSNTNLTNSRVHNFKRMQQRRVVFTLSVVYQSTTDQIRNIPGIVNEIIRAQDKVRLDRGHFSGFAPSSLNFEFVYYVNSADYNVYMDVQQEIYLQIVSAFEREKISFAYPTQTVFLNTRGETNSSAKTEFRVNERLS